jgi:hypothetical protein
MGNGEILPVELRQIQHGLADNAAEAKRVEDGGIPRAHAVPVPRQRVEDESPTPRKPSRTAGRKRSSASVTLYCW